MKAKPLASDAALSLRLPTDLIRRADALIPAMAAEALKEGETRASRSLVFKKAIEEGLKVLEVRAARAAR